MNWLYFFMGVTAAWVFMGLILFGSDILRNVFRLPKKTNDTDRLLEYWDTSTQNQQLQIEAIRYLESAVLSLKK